MKTGQSLFPSTLFFLILIGWAQQLQATGLKTVCRLPEQVEETSGIEVTGANEIWTLNDSGGKAELYLCDTLGNLIRTVKIEGAENHDWEDLAQDNKGNFYICDTGNNNNDRDNLRIYKIPNPDLNKKDELEAEKIKFTYEDQTEFPPGKNNMDYDCEAVIWYNNHLYLFSKTRSFPFKTSVYQLPDTPGEYVARKLATFHNGGKDITEADLHSFWITAADISPNGKQLALLSQDRMWIFYDFKKDHFFSGKHKVYELGSNTQKESVCFVDNSTLYMTDEYWSTFNIGRNLYKLTINPQGQTSSAKHPSPDKRQSASQ